MTIHHTQQKKAAGLGLTLTEDVKTGSVEAFWPKHNLRLFGVSAPDALAQAIAAQEIYSRIIEIDGVPQMVHHPEQQRLVNFHNGHGWLVRGYDTPISALLILDEPNTEPFQMPDPREPEADPIPTAETPPKEIERINGVAIDGAIAYREGTPAGDCPFSSEDEEGDEYTKFVQWNDEWDAAADEASDEENKEGGSVVRQKFRDRYKELGHPAHCGDWLAETLNNMCLTKKGIDVERFEAICNLNGVSLAKYKHEGKGWEGRLRMTGRNLMAKVVFYADGLLKGLDENSQPIELKAPGEWMQSQRFKPAKKAEAPAEQAQ